MPTALFRIAVSLGPILGLFTWHAYADIVAGRPPRQAQDSSFIQLLNTLSALPLSVFFLLTGFVILVGAFMIFRMLKKDKEALHTNKDDAKDQQ